MAQYAQVAAPLTNLLGRDGFFWTEETRETFDQLNTVLTTASMLIFLDFSIPFVVETNACEVGIEVVLLQQGHPIAYFSKKLSNDIELLHTLRSSGHSPKRFENGVTTSLEVRSQFGQTTAA